jgi:hypothetical protein
MTAAATELLATAGRTVAGGRRRSFAQMVGSVKVVPEPGSVVAGKVPIGKLQSREQIEAELSARNLLAVPRETLERTDPRWKSCAELRALLPTVEDEEGNTYLEGGLLGDPEARLTYDENASVVTADSGITGFAACAIM